MLWVFLYITMLAGGLLIFGATGDLVSAGRYDLLFGPIEIAKSVSCLGDAVDDEMALRSALAREYGTTDLAAVIKLLSDRYDAANPVTTPTFDLTIDVPINHKNPLDGVMEGGLVLRDFYGDLSRFDRSCRIP